MYKKYSCYFLVLYFMMMAAVLNVKLLTDLKKMPDELHKKNQIQMMTDQIVFKNYEKTLEKIYGYERMIECSRIEQNYRVDLDDREFEVLCRIVQAEAGCEDAMGKMLVADVVLNRVESPRFPDDVEDVVFQNSNGIYQFSPVRSGRYYDVVVTEETREAVVSALLEEDVSGGALYFASRRHAGSGMRWFDENLTCVAKYGGHEFFR